MTSITLPTEVSRRQSVQRIAEGVIATYIHDISARRRRPARVVDLRRAGPRKSDRPNLEAA
jgi:hypothetical protein